MIENSTKEQIAEALIKCCDNEKSDNYAAKVLGINNNYISNIRNKNWGMIGDDMWRKISNIVGVKLATMVAHADTTQYKSLMGIYNLARERATSHAIIIAPGSGKTYSLDRLRASTPNVFYAKCRRSTTECELYREILRTMGKNTNDKSISALQTMIEQVIDRKESPIIVIDEIERIEKPGPLLSMTDLKNLLHRKCAIVLLGTQVLQDKIQNSRNVGRAGYNTLASRYRFVEIPPPSAKDGALVAKAYGFTGDKIDELLSDAKSFDHPGIDLRQLEVVIEKNR